MSQPKSSRRSAILWFHVLGMIRINLEIIGGLKKFFMCPLVLLFPSKIWKENEIKMVNICIMGIHVLLLIYLLIPKSVIFVFSLTILRLLGNHKPDRCPLKDNHFSMACVKLEKMNKADMSVSLLVAVWPWGSPYVPLPTSDSSSEWGELKLYLRRAAQMWKSVSVYSKCLVSTV